MRACIFTLLILSLSFAVGCDKPKEKPVASDEPITPTGMERKVLEVHHLDPKSERGQQKLRRMRERQAKLDAAKERMDEWAEEAAKRDAEEAQE